MIKPGANIVWKGEGFLFGILSPLLGLLDASWRARPWKGWHTGYVVKVLDTGEIVTNRSGRGSYGVYPVEETPCPSFPVLDNCC